MQSCEKRKKCGSCRVNLLEAEYKTKRNGELTSLCIRCLNTVKRRQDKKREERLSDTSSCSSESSTEITEKNKPDGKLNNQCIRCRDIKNRHTREKCYCVHNTRKDACKRCNNPIQITINYMLNHSKRQDKLYNRYDPINFIDRCFLENLIEDCEDKCHYCQTELQYIEYGPDLATIERLDNKIGHIKSNCTIACLSCNLSHNNKD